MKRTIILVPLCLMVTAVMLQCGKKGSPTEIKQDTTVPPKITAVYPATGSAGLALNTLIYVTFDRPMNHSATEGALAVDKMTGAKSWKYNILIFKPDSSFRASDTVRFTVSTAAKDNNGTALAAAASYTFTCRADSDSTHPFVVAHGPTGTGAGIDAQVTASFNKKLAPWSDNAITLKDSSSGAVIGGSAALVSDSILRFIPSNLSYLAAYSVTVSDTAVHDLCGHQMTAPVSWYFRTMADTVRPFVTKTEPADTASNISVNTPVKIHFSEPMNTASVLAALTYNPALSFNAAWSGDSVLTLSMTDTLSFHTLHHVTIGTGALDKAGNHLASAFPFTFTTVRGIGIACAGINQYYLYQQADLRPEGYHGTYPGARQPRFSPDGRWLYLLANDGLHMFDARNHYSESAPANLGVNCYGLAISPDGSRLAVSDTMNKWLYLIDALSLSKLDSVQTIHGFPKGVCFAQSGSKIAALCWGQVEIYSVSNLHNTPVIVTIPNNGEEIALSPSGDRLFAASNSVVTVINTSDNSWFYIDIVNVSTHPWGLALSPDGLHLAVSCYDEGGVKIYNAHASASSSPVYTVSVGTGTRPKGLCYSPDGNCLYVALSGTNQVTRLKRYSSYAADTTLTTGAGPCGIAVTP